MTKTNRRTFMKQAGLVTGAAFTPYFSGQTVRAADKLPASDRIRVGCIGVGSMGQGDAQHFSAMSDVVAICDVDSQYGLARTLANQHIGAFKDGKRTAPDTYKHYRDVLDRDDIDAVSIVTVDHWHTKIAVEALLAGKHVFCQKPLTLTLEENQLIRAAAKKNPKLIFQVGTQQRSQRDQFMAAALIVRKGLIGKVHRVTCDIGGSPTSPELPVAKPSDSLDWNLWLGQAPFVEYRAGTDCDGDGIPHYSRAHYQFRWWYEYSGGKFTDWGAHHIDCAMWALNLVDEGIGPVSLDGSKAKHPVEFVNGYPVRDDCFNSSHEFEIPVKFAGGLEMLVVSDSKDGNGILFEGEKGRFHVNRERIRGRVWEEGAKDMFKDEDFAALYNGKQHEDHKLNMLRCIREGGLPVSDVYSHVQAMNVCHLCTVAARLGREIKWDAANEKIVGDDLAASFFGRKRRDGFDIPDLR